MNSLILGLQESVTLLSWGLGSRASRIPVRRFASIRLVLMPAGLSGKKESGNYAHLEK